MKSIKHPLNIFFDKIFVVSIKRNSSRLNLIENILENIDHEVYEGVDGKELYPDIEHVFGFPDNFFYKNNLDSDRCKIWNKGQLGCALSHRNLHLEIISRGLEKVLILEDDALIVNKNVDIFSSAIKQLSTDWELLYLGYNQISKYSHINILRPLLKLKYNLKPIVIDGLSSSTKQNNFLPRYFSDDLHIPGLYMGTHAYGLTLEGARKLFKFDSPLKYGFDNLLMQVCYYGNLKSFALNKPLFVPNEKFDTSLIN